MSPNQINVNSEETRPCCIEGKTEYDVLPLLIENAEGPHLSPYLNIAYLDAEFTKTKAAGVAIGNDPSCAPHYVIREGLLWRKDHAYNSATAQRMSALGNGKTAMRALAALQKFLLMQ